MISKEENKKLKKEYQDILDYKDKSIKNETEAILEVILKRIEWNFELIIDFDFSKETKKIFELLKKKKRTAKFMESTEGEFGVECPKMDKDFMRKYIEGMFFPEDFRYTFKDNKNKIILFEGGIQIQ